jgi:hypothetical protein
MGQMGLELLAGQLGRGWVPDRGRPGPSVGNTEPVMSDLGRS